MPPYLIVLVIAGILYSLVVVGGYSLLSSKMKRIEGLITKPPAEIPASNPRDGRSVAVKVAYFSDPTNAEVLGLEFLFVIVKSSSVSSERRDAEGIKELEKPILDLLELIHNFIDYHLSCRIWHKDGPREAVESMKDRLKDTNIQVVSVEEL